jgi:anti-anti-sigma regulatory factor
MTARAVPIIVCDLRAVRDADLATVDAFARLALAVRRAGFELRLSGVARELAELFALAGLDGLLAGGEAGRQPEQREQAIGVEEEGQLGGGAA